MTENVIVTIKGLQFDSVDENVVEVINIGRFSEINNKIYVKYDEILEGEMRTATNLIKIGEGIVEITKRGPVSTHMRFLPNEKTMSLYNTPFGSFDLGILARSVDIDKKEDAIQIFIEYSLELNEEIISECKVEICIKPQNRADKFM